MRSKKIGWIVILMCAAVSYALPLSSTTVEDVASSTSAPKKHLIPGSPYTMVHFQLDTTPEQYKDFRDAMAAEKIYRRPTERPLSATRQEVWDGDLGVADDGKTKTAGVTIVDALQHEYEKWLEGRKTMEPRVEFWAQVDRKGAEGPPIYSAGS